jgi:hypothetical protein
MTCRIKPSTSLKHQRGQPGQLQQCTCRVTTTCPSSIAHEAKRGVRAEAGRTGGQAQAGIGHAC